MSEDAYPGGYVRTEWKMLCKARCEHPNATLADLGLMLGRSAQTIRLWLQKPDYQRYENWVIDKSWSDVPSRDRYEPSSLEVRERISTYASEMEERLRDIIESSSDEKLVAGLCQDYLDRAGYAAVKKVERTDRKLVLSAEALLLLDQRSLEAGLPPLLPKKEDAA